MSVVELSAPRPSLERLPRRVRLPGRELAGFLTAPHPDLRRAAAVLAEPEVTCTVEIAVATEAAGRWRRLHARHALRGDLVAAVSSAGADVEVAWCGIEHWQTELARAATVAVPPGGPPPAPGLEVPLEVVLAAGPAARGSRSDLLEELARRAVRGASPSPAPRDRAGHSGLREQLARLHTSVVGRLLATVAARDEQGRTRVGWLSWLLYRDGWCSLVPVRRAAGPTVRLAAARPLDLGREVGALVTAVRGRS